MDRSCTGRRRRDLTGWCRCPPDMESGQEKVSAVDSSDPDHRAGLG